MLPSCAAVVLLTSLFRACCGGVAEEGGRNGCAEVWEKVKDGESTRMLDLGLPCWDSGRMDKRRIHDPLDETESRETSEMGGGTHSFCRMKECRRLEALGGAVCGRLERGGREVLAGLGPMDWGDG